MKFLKAFVLLMLLTSFATQASDHIWKTWAGTYQVLNCENQLKGNAGDIWKFATSSQGTTSFPELYKMSKTEEKLVVSFWKLNEGPIKLWRNEGALTREESKAEVSNGELRLTKEYKKVKFIPVERLEETYLITSPEAGVLTLSYEFKAWKAGGSVESGSDYCAFTIKTNEDSGGKTNLSK